MSHRAELFWSFRSPYSYLGTKRYRQLAADYDIDIVVRPVFPIAIRTPEFFKKVNPLWIQYLLRDCARVAKFNNLGFGFPNPDPVVMNIETREISPDQPYIFRLTRLGVEAARRGRGLEFLDEISQMIWGGKVQGWDQGDHMALAAERAGLSLSDMEAAIAGNEASYDAEIEQNQEALEAAGHWGVPTLVYENEPFFGQDRIDMALWSMKATGLKERD